MKKITLLTCLLLFYSVLALISGCGGGGGGGGSSTPGTTPSQPTTAIVKLSTSGTLSSGTLIGGADITLALPAGVSVKSTTNPPQTDAGVITASGVAASSTTIAVYTVTTNTLPGKVRIMLVNANGFSTGEFVTISCDIAVGNSPTAAGFSLVNFSAVNVNGSAISGLTTGLTADIR